MECNDCSIELEQLFFLLKLTECVLLPKLLALLANKNASYDDL